MGSRTALSKGSRGALEERREWPLAEGHREITARGSAAARRFPSPMICQNAARTLLYTSPISAVRVIAADGFSSSLEKGARGATKKQLPL